MKYLQLVWAALARRKTRTVLTILSVLVAFLLFGLLDGVRAAFNAGGTLAGVDRMVVSSRFSIIQGLPPRPPATPTRWTPTPFPSSSTKSATCRITGKSPCPSPTNCASASTSCR